MKAELIITITETGKTSRLVSKYRPRVPVVCVTNDVHTANYLILSRATIPIIVPSVKGTESILTETMEKCKQMGLCKSGSNVVVVAGIVEGVSGNTNSLRVVRVP